MSARSPRKRVTLPFGRGWLKFVWPAVKLNAEPLREATCFTDHDVPENKSNAWFVRPVVKDMEQPESARFSLKADAPAQPYLAVPLKTLPGYLGEESWENTATGLVSNVYYWDSLEALQALVKHPLHLEAKAAQARWLAIR